MVLPVPPGYQILDATSTRSYAAGVAALASHLGGDAASWQVNEVGDGNMNLVFVLKGQAGSCVIKQALPYIRSVGESWPLKLDRMRFEYHCLLRHGRHAPNLMPQIYHYDERMALLAMEYLSPHIILRKGLVAGERYPQVAEQLAEYMSQSLFKTSDLYMKPEEKRADLRLFAENSELCEASEDVIFTSPYYAAELNRWTSPQLDEMVTALRADGQLKTAVQALKYRFMTCSQALLHGDFHTGSVMVTPEEAKVIDTEFAFYGPMGFDVGALQANWLLAYFSQRGYEQNPGQREGYRTWILEQVRQTWQLFSQKFAVLWRTERRGSAFSRQLFEEQDTSSEAALQQLLYEVRQDAMGFCGAKMLRRLIGISHVEDMENIADTNLRAACEKGALQLARQLVVEHPKLDGFEDICQLAQKLENRN